MGDNPDGRTMTSFEKLLAIFLLWVIIFGAVEGGAVARLSGGSQLLGMLAGLLFAGYSIIIGYIFYRTEGGNRSWFFHELVEEAKRTIREGKAAENRSYPCLERSERIPESASF